MELTTGAKIFCLKFMQNIAIGLFLLIFGLLCTHKVTSDGVDVGSEEFNVQPGGQEHTKERELNGVVCKFTYVAQGGTNEKWVMTLTTDQGSGYHCSISRPDKKSYLFFMQFKLEIHGATLQRGEAFGASGKPLNDNEYKIEKGKERGEVTSVSGKFQSQLTAVLLDGRIVKEEL